MPLINRQLVENVSAHEQRQQVLEEITDAIAAIEGDAPRGVTWVTVEEVEEGNWAAGHEATRNCEPDHRKTNAA